MNNFRVTIAVFLAALVFTATFSNSVVEAKKKMITISFACKTKSDCLRNIACEACTDCRCDKGLCRCHGFGGNPTAAPLTA
ncbi:PREDICTED: defensin-like protein 287 [Camelina sativa]|uniref:Defensin-like protein 287 n=1 Tax=Camelina sativa TaxID=90675 RepID=A0ABM1QXD9_CAMSA|nr:PREDICTED: defensin-like protein 287 [Camelina sativa]